SPRCLIDAPTVESTADSLRVTGSVKGRQASALTLSRSALAIAAFVLCVCLDIVPTGECPMDVGKRSGHREICVGFGVFAFPDCDAHLRTHLAKDLARIAGH